MRRPTRTVVERFIKKAKKLWGLDDWVITWKWEKCKEGAEIDFHLTEFTGVITLDPDYVKTIERKRLFRDIVHECGHPVVGCLWRGVSDFADHYIPKGRERNVYEEQFNTRENELIDRLITKVLKIEA